MMTGVWPSAQKRDGMAQAPYASAMATRVMTVQPSRPVVSCKWLNSVLKFALSVRIFFAMFPTD